jgi:hypothetical protein
MKEPKMNPFRRLIVYAALAWLMLVPLAIAAPPQTINYQGYLTNISGLPAISTVPMTFRLYDALSVGTLLWSESQTVVVTSGVFNVALGSGTLVTGTPLGNLAFDAPYFLEVVVGAETLAPRQSLSASPYARRAAVADAVSTSTPLIIGSNNIAPCDASHAGSLRWNIVAVTMQLCDGAAWRALTVGPQTFTVEGTVSGLVGTLQLQNNGNAITVSANGGFAFPIPLVGGNPYSVTVLAQPAGQLCSVANVAGTIVNANVTNVAVTCTTPTPLLWYRFEGSGSNDGSLPGFAMSLFSSTFVPGKVGQGAVFGPGGYAQVSGMGSVLGAYGQITVAFWMNEAALLNSVAFWDIDNRTVAPYGGVQLAQALTGISVCASTTTTAYLSGACTGFTSPSANAWHHWIIRYSGTGTGAGQGGPIEFYVDGVLVLTRANDASNNPVFNSSGMPDTMYLGASGVTVDDFKIFNRTFTAAEQCTFIIGGAWNGASCTLP